ncbi:hypothetical protein D5272_01320 [bacterium D16-76]|nr:hypothetical protein [bacterium D16-76]
MKMEYANLPGFLRVRFTLIHQLIMVVRILLLKIVLLKRAMQRAKGILMILLDRLVIQYQVTIRLIM